MRKYQDSISSAVSGLPVYQAQIFLYDQDMAPVQLYSDEGVTPLAQPVLTDGLGLFEFFVADGTYFLGVADPDGTNLRYFPDIEIYEDARNVSVPVGETGFVLPSAAARANGVLGFDASGNPSMTTISVVVDEAVDAVEAALAADVAASQAARAGAEAAQSAAAGSASAASASAAAAAGSASAASGSASSASGSASAAAASAASIAGSVSAAAASATAAATSASGAASSASAAAGSASAAGTSATSASSALATAIALFNSVGPTQFYTSKTLANSGFAAAANLSTAQVFPDSTKSNRASLYYKNTATDPSNWIWIRYMDAPPTYYVHSKYGSDANDGLTPDTPKQSLTALDTLVSTNPGATIALGRGSHWYGQYPDFQDSAWSKVIDWGQGQRPIIDGAQALFVGTWTNDPTYTDTWYQDFTLPNPTQGSGPGDVNRWHIGMWDEKPASVPSDISDTETRLTEGWLKRVLNGDPDPDPATFDNNRPQTTTLAYTARSDFLTKVNTFANTFCVFPTVGTGYEPNDGTPRTAFRAYIHLADGSNPNTNGRTLRINEQRGLFTTGRGMDVNNVIFARCGGKDMIAGFQDLTGLPRASGAKDIFAGNFYNCSFWEATHGPVCAGMGGQDCDYIGHYMRDAYKGSAGAYHDFRSIGGVNKGLGMGWVRCKAKRFGYMFYCHGGGDGSDQQNRILYVDTAFADDGVAIAVAGQASQGYWLRNVVGRSIDSIGASCYPESTYENCKFYLRAGIANSIGGGSNPLTVTYPVANAGTARFINSLVISLGTSLALPMGPLATLTQPQMVNLKMERSTIWGLIPSQTNTQYKQLNITMDRYSYLGVFDSGSAGDINLEFYPTGTVTAQGADGSGNFGSIIECLRTTPDTLRAAHAGIEAGVETGMFKQVWQHTVIAADLVYVALNAVNATSWVDNGDGTATVTTGFNFGTNGFTRGIKIAGINAAGADYLGVVRSVPDNTHVIVAPVPTGTSPTTGAITSAFYRPTPFKDPITAYISTNGTQLNVASADGMVVGQMFHAGHPVAGQPSFGLRKITAISGTVITLDKACPWLQRENNVTYRAIATPTSGTGRTLPTLTVTYGFPIQRRVLSDASFVYPQFLITKVEGGTLSIIQNMSVFTGEFIQAGLVNVGFNSQGTAAAYTNIDYEAGYFNQSLGVGIGDIVTLTAEVDVSEYRLAFNTPPELGGYSPTNTCLTALRRIGYRASI